MACVGFNAHSRNTLGRLSDVTSLTNVMPQNQAMRPVIFSHHVSCSAGRWEANQPAAAANPSPMSWLGT